MSSSWGSQLALDVSGVIRRTGLCTGSFYWHFYLTKTQLRQKKQNHMTGNSYKEDLFKGKNKNNWDDEDKLATNKVQLEFGIKFLFCCKRSRILRQPSNWHSKAKKTTGKKYQPRLNVVLLGGVVEFYEIDSVATKTAEDFVSVTQKSPPLGWLFNADHEICCIEMLSPLQVSVGISGFDGYSHFTQSKNVPKDMKWPLRA